MCFYQLDGILLSFLFCYYACRVLPSLIVLGGGIMSEDMLIKDINEKVQAQLEPNYKHVRIVKAQLRNKAGMLGAAWLASERLKNWNK